MRSPDQHGDCRTTGRVFSSPQRDRGHSTPASSCWPASTATSKPPIRQLTFHFGAIDHLVQQLVADEVAWQQYFTDHGIQPFTVVYEELTEAYEETACKILCYLALPIPEKQVFAERRMKRQADTLSKEWIERYYQLK